jgi:hypothetical protein
MPWGPKKRSSSRTREDPPELVLVDEREDAPAVGAGHEGIGDGREQVVVALEIGADAPARRGSAR